jgi:hypothetical protein
MHGAKQQKQKLSYVVVLKRGRWWTEFLNKKYLNIKEEVDCRRI